MRAIVYWHVGDVDVSFKKLVSFVDDVSIFPAGKAKVFTAITTKLHIRTGRQMNKRTTLCEFQA